MKNIFSISLLFTVALAFASCDRELMDYEGKDTLYFDIRRGAEWIDPAKWPHEFFSTVDFGNMSDDIYPLSLKICAAGTIRDYDRSFKVTVVADSTTMASGTHFSGVQDSYMIKAGEVSTQVNLLFTRTEDMFGDTLRLQLRIEPNEYFDTMFERYEDYPSTYSPTVNKSFDGNRNAAVHNVFAFDVLSRPSGWMGNDETGLGLMGRFSAVKYKYLMEISGTTVDDFTSAKMPSARAQAITTTAAKDLIEKAKAGNPILDDDGTMMYVSYVSSLGGQYAWAPFTKPEDYYKDR